MAFTGRSNLIMNVFLSVYSSFKNSQQMQRCINQGFYSIWLDVWWISACNEVLYMKLKTSYSRIYLGEYRIPDNLERFFCFFAQIRFKVVALNMFWDFKPKQSSITSGQRETIFPEPVKLRWKPASLQWIPISHWQILGQYLARKLAFFTNQNHSIYHWVNRKGIA